MNEWIIGAPWRKELLQGAPATPRRRSAGNAESSTVYLTEGGGEQRSCFGGNEMKGLYI